MHLAELESRHIAQRRREQESRRAVLRAKDAMDIAANHVETMRKVSIFLQAV